MSKLLSILVAALFATVSAGSFAASHGGAMKDDKKIKVELKIARVEWGNDRSLVMALEPMLEEVADRASRLGRESSLSAPLGG